VVGNAAIEVIRRPRTNEVAMAYYMPITDCRMCLLDEEPTKVRVVIPRDGKPTTLYVKKQFRRFVQVRATGDVPLKWFKSFGDKRYLDATTGEYKSSASQCVEVATELMWLSNSVGGQPYGLPRWVGAVTDILGRCQAQFVNYDLFDHQGIPPMLIIVENGSLTDESREDLQNLIESMRGARNFNKLGLLEAVPEVSGLDEEAHVKIRIQNMIENRNQDLLFNTFLKYSSENIRQVFRLPALYLGAVSSYSYACHSDDTEVLTDTGWKLHGEVKTSDKLATVDTSTFELEYQEPTAFHTYDVDTPLIHFNTPRGIDVLVTRNHDMFCAKIPNEGYPQVWEKALAVELLGKRREFLSAPSGYKHIDDRHFIRFPNGRFVSIEGLAPFVACVVADGTVPKGKSGRKEIYFYIKKERKKIFISEAIESLATELGVRWRCADDRTNPGRVRLSIYSKELHSWLCQNIFAKPRDELFGVESTHNKKLPDWFVHLPKCYLQLIFDALMATDGHIGSPNSWVYSSTSKILADQVQIIALHLGYGSFIMCPNLDERGRHQDYRVNIVSSNIRRLSERDAHFNFEPYKGKVFCFTTPNGTLVTRRNGRIGIHGNSAFTAKTIGEEQVFSPERTMWDDVINRQFVNNSFNCDLWRYTSKGPTMAGAPDIINAIREFSNAGALSINNSIDILNNMLGLQISKIDEEWASHPYGVVQELLRQGRLDMGSMASVIESPNENVLITEQMPPPASVGGTNPKLQIAAIDEE
jgi:capsid portal protein